MIPIEIQKKIRHLEISTRRILSGSLIGDSRSALKGFGFDFDQIREYHVGDDVRFIDWKSSSRTNQLLVKQYIEERNRKIIIVVDISASSLYGSLNVMRAELHAQLAGVLALVSSYGQDAVGLLLFSDMVECFIPPARGRMHIHMIMQRLFAYTPRRTKTHINVALEYLAQLRNTQAVVCMISDFIDTGFEKMLRTIGRRYDVIAVRSIDRRERSFEDVGFLSVHDPETGQEYVLDTRARAGKKCTEYLHNRLHQQRSLFKKHGISLLDMEIGKPFMQDLVTFFRRRMVY